MNFTQSVEELDRKAGLEAKIRFDEGRKIDAFAALRLGVGAFRRVYYSEKACREGVKGLFRSVNEGMFHFLTYAKHWELERNR